MPEKLFGLDVQGIATGLSIFIAGLMVAIGNVFGKKDKDKPPPQVELAGAVIDNRKASEMIGAFVSLTEALEENSGASRDTVSGIAAIISEVRRVGDEMRRVNDELKTANSRLEAMKDELIRINNRR